MGVEVVNLSTLGSSKGTCRRRQTGTHKYFNVQVIFEVQPDRDTHYDEFND
jgi:hypothetical protein